MRWLLDNRLIVQDEEKPTDPEYDPKYGDQSPYTEERTIGRGYVLHRRNSAPYAGKGDTYERVRSSHRDRDDLCGIYGWHRELR